jgi:hypothetical protein
MNVKKQNDCVVFSAKLWMAIQHFFSEVPGSLKDHLNTTELIRIAVAALTAGGGVFGLLQAIETNVGLIFPSPADTALASAILTLLLETMRRLGHGQKAGLPQGRRAL